MGDEGANTTLFEQHPCRHGRAVSNRAAKYHPSSESYQEAELKA